MRGRHLVAICAAVAIGALTVATIAWGGANSRQVQMLDNCDGPSFNAALQDPEACVRNGGLSFDKFVARLIEKGSVESWRFSPEQLSMDAGGTITSVNRGGEPHTFSEVAQFGGGCIEDVNELVGLTPVPECANFPGPPGGPFFGATLVLPGDSLTTAPLAAGTHRFLCLIHPWMRTTATVN
jgi:plastocyanin